MGKTERRTAAHVVVEVARGVAVAAHAFRRLQPARRCLSRLRRECNLEEDDVQLFSVVLHGPPSPERTVPGSRARRR